MSKVIAEFTMTLDGYVADPNDGVDRVLRWYSAGDTAFEMGGGPPFKISRASADLLAATWGQFGAIVTGRRDFDVSKAWGGKPLFGVPTFIVTHYAPEAWLGPDSPFTFVTEGVPAAIAQARAAAGGGTVAVSGTTIVQQALAAGLIDEIQIDLAHMLLGAGRRLFDQLPQPIDLESLGAIEGTGVTHLRFRVVR